MELRPKNNSLASPNHGPQPPTRSPSPVALEPFVHQVGGHFPMVCLDQDTVCKPLNDREHKFYKSLPTILKPFAPAYEGTMSVETTEDEDGYIVIRGQPPPSHCRRIPCSNPTNPTSPHFRLKRNESLEIETTVCGSSSEMMCSKSLPAGAGMAVGSHHQDDASLIDDFTNLRKASDGGGSSEISTEEGTFYNPWALKCHSHHLKKMGLLRPASSSGQDHQEKDQQQQQVLKPQMYLLLENLVSKYRFPCILDLKLGARQYSDDVSSAKKQRKIAKSANSTSATLGIRLCGMQVYNAATSHYTCHNKYYGRTLTPDSFRDTIADFFNNGYELRTDVIANLADRLVDLGKILQTLDSYRFYTSSLLVTYDGNYDDYDDDDDDNHSQENQPPDVSDLVDVRIIDFAHSTHKGLRDSVLHNGPDEGFIFGLNNFVAILNELLTKGDDDTTIAADEN